jgi:hypothetical protein
MTRQHAPFLSKKENRISVNLTTTVLHSFSIFPAQHRGNHNEQLLHAAQAGTARELFEETGLAVAVDRLQPVHLPTAGKKGSSSNKELVNEFKHRLFYYCLVTDDDFLSSGGVTPIYTTNAGCQNLKIKISHEHAGFTFQNDPRRAAEMLKLHSGGTPSEVLLMALSNSKHGDGSSGQASGDGHHAYGFLVNSKD